MACRGVWSVRRASKRQQTDVVMIRYECEVLTVRDAQSWSTCVKLCVQLSLQPLLQRTRHMSLLVQASLVMFTQQPFTYSLPSTFVQLVKISYCNCWALRDKINNWKRTLFTLDGYKIRRFGRSKIFNVIIRRNITIEEILLSHYSVSSEEMLWVRKTSGVTRVQNILGKL